MHKMAEPAMKDLYVRLWPSEPVLCIYFGLVAKLCDASARIDVVKHLVCIEGAHMAFVKTMVHWPKIKPVEMATGPPPAGKEHRRQEQYFAAVMDGAQAMEAQCSKDIFLE